MKKNKYINNEKGSSILSYIMIILVTAILAIKIIPLFNEASLNRSKSITNVFNSTDTITTVE